MKETHIILFDSHPGVRGQEIDVHFFENPAILQFKKFNPPIIQLGISVSWCEE